VLDEADRMLDMGFVDDIKAIAARCPAERQTLLFSATLDGVVGNLARELTRDAQRIEIEAVPHKESKIEQRLLFADNMDHKNRLLDALLRDVEMTQAIVFASTKRSTEEISDLLADSGFASDALHGDMQQGQRNRALQRLREGRTKVLVATDVARAASTWRPSATSSTSTCRVRPRTMSIASAAPAVPVVPASR